MAADLLRSLLPFYGCLVKPVPDGLSLHGASEDWLLSVALTPRSFRPPFVLRTVAQTDSTNLRLYWHLGTVIFNWECSVRQLRIHHPDTGDQFGIADKGFITTNQWHEISWEVFPTSMRVVVDGELRYEGRGQWSEIEAPLGIAPCFGSTVAVRSFVVEEP
ncbi:MAG: hypothetical protein ACT4PM_03895 [Gemmatimonadales bacterium]